MYDGHGALAQYLLHHLMGRPDEIIQGFGAYGNASLGSPELGVVLLTESGLYACEVRPEVPGQESAEGGSPEEAARRAEARKGAEKASALQALSPQERVDGAGWYMKWSTEVDGIASLSLEGVPERLVIELTTTHDNVEKQSGMGAMEANQCVVVPRQKEALPPFRRLANAVWQRHPVCKKDRAAT